MSGYKGVVKCEVWIDMEDVNHYADGVGEFQNLIRSLFKELKKLPEVNEVHSQIVTGYNNSIWMESFKIKPEMTECDMSLTLVDASGKEVQVLDDGGR